VNPNAPTQPTQTTQTTQTVKIVQTVQAIQIITILAINKQKNSNHIILYQNLSLILLILQLGKTKH
jgi:hypothetical protein